MTRRYFSVTAKHGHCGSRRYKPITFAFLATDAVRAMELAKLMPGVKHSQTILKCKEISYAEYMEYRKHSAYERMEGKINGD
jgi:hypothetical protein